MGHINLDGKFKVTGTLYAVYINNFAVFHSLFLTTCYRYVLGAYNNSNDKLLKSYSQVTRSVNKHTQVIMKDSIGTEFMIKSINLFK